MVIKGMEHLTCKETLTGLEVLSLRKGRLREFLSMWKNVLWEGTNTEESSH